MPICTNVFYRFVCLYERQVKALKVDPHRQGIVEYHTVSPGDGWHYDQSWRWPEDQVVVQRGLHRGRGEGRCELTAEGTVVQWDQRIGPCYHSEI